MKIDIGGNKEMDFERFPNPALREINEPIPTLVVTRQSSANCPTPPASFLNRGAALVALLQIVSNF